MVLVTREQLLCPVFQNLESWMSLSKNTVSHGMLTLPCLILKPSFIRLMGHEVHHQQSRTRFLSDPWSPRVSELLAQNEPEACNEQWPARFGRIRHVRAL